MLAMDWFTLCNRSEWAYFPKNGVVWCEEVLEFKAGRLTRCFRSSVFCGREELPLLQTFGFLTLKTFYMRENLFETLNERKKLKKGSSSLKNKKRNLSVRAKT